jgi:hypothetical protein
MFPQHWAGPKKGKSINIDDYQYIVCIQGWKKWLENQSLKLEKDTKVYIWNDICKS